MFSSRFFWKIYATSAGLVLATAIAIGWLALGQLEHALLDEKETSLRQQCQRLGRQALEAFVSEGRESLEPLGEPLAGPQVRITLIRADGTVLVDSDHDVASMENHLDRPEVQEALETGWGVSRRRSGTARARLFYVAHRYSRTSGAPLGVVRLALQVDDIDRELDAMRTRLLGGALVGVLLAMGVGAFAARRITRPIAELTAAAQDLRAGHYSRRVASMPRDELGVLGDAMNQLGIEITRRMGDLLDEEARLRAMLAGMVEGVVAVDEDERVVFSNRAARTLLGITELQGHKLWEVVRIPELDELIVEARETDAAARRELAFADASSRDLLVQAQAHRFRIGEHLGVVVVLHDQTELRRLERVRRDFVANVSHELKTPLTSIRGYVETLLSGALHDEQNNVRFLERIDSNVRRLTHLVADLLSLARIESPEQEIALEPIDLVGMLRQAVRQHGPRAQEKGVACALEKPAEPVRVLGDRESLGQVIDNLVDNAIKYTSEGSVTLTARVDGVSGVLEVRDTGIGISAEDLERVFERFYRADKARSRELGGTGLGLSIVKHLVAAMQGEVAIESVLDEGTTLRVSLPLSEPPHAGASRSETEV